MQSADVVWILRHNVSAYFTLFFTSFAFIFYVLTVIFWQEAVTVIESVYSRYANAPQRSAMAAEFYGKTFTVFRVGMIYD